jgi:hypothetical protein
MMLSARPLLDNAVDAALFVDREDSLARITTALERGLNVLVTGDPGLGKTSLVRQVMYRARTPDPVAPLGEYPMRFVRAEGIQDGHGLLSQIVTGDSTGGTPIADLLEQLAAERAAVTDDPAAHPHPEGREPTATALRPVIIVDDVTATAGHDVFGRLRDQLWETGYQWIVTVRSSDRGGLLTPPADAFFETVLDLPALEPEAATALLTARSESDWGAFAAQVSRLVGGNPRRLIGAARDLVDLPKGEHQAWIEAIALRDRRIHALGRSESMLAAELESLGGASASDQRLLDRLGWSRARAVQVLTKLEDEGLVVGEEVASGQGRPRKVYRLVSAQQLLPRGADSEAGQ